MAEPTRKQAGFTLFEVLGAVAIMGISYVMLATIALQSVRAIGESQRRIEASLLADERLAEIELAAEIGQLIEFRDEELDEEPFLVRIEILDMEENYGNTTGHVDDSTDLIGFLAAESIGPFAEHRNSNWLLGYLREVHITVSWMEGIEERALTRTAFIFDQQAWIETEGQGEEGAEGGTGDGTDDDDALGGDGDS